MHATRPNILFVTADMMRADAMGCAGTQVRTPHWMSSLPKVSDSTTLTRRFRSAFRHGTRSSQASTRTCTAWYRGEGRCRLGRPPSPVSWLGWDIARNLWIDAVQATEHLRFRDDPDCRAELGELPRRLQCALEGEGLR